MPGYLFSARASLSRWAKWVFPVPDKIFRIIEMDYFAVVCPPFYHLAKRKFKKVLRIVRRNYFFGWFLNSVNRQRFSGQTLPEANSCNHISQLFQVNLRSVDTRKILFIRFTIVYRIYPGTTRGLIAQEKITLSHLVAIKMFLKRSDLSVRLATAYFMPAMRTIKTWS